MLLNIVNKAPKPISEADTIKKEEKRQKQISKNKKRKEAPEKEYTKAKIARLAQIKEETPLTEEEEAKNAEEAARAAIAGEEAIQAKKKKIKRIIEERRKNLAFSNKEARDLNVKKNEELIPGLEARREDVFSEMTFENLGIQPGILKSLTKMGFTNLTKVQMEIYKTINKRSNAIVRSVTGSGKTLAYMVPIINDLLSIGYKISRQDGLYVIILSPTKELCNQIFDVCVRLCSGCINIVPGKMVGGEDMNHEKSRLRKGINILVSTPARLMYHLEHTRNLTLGNLRTLVVEESDLSLSMGQGLNVKSVIDRIHETKPEHFLQKIFTTACYDRRVKDMIDDCLQGNFELVGGLNIEDSEKDLEKEEVLIPEHLNQNYVLVEENCKLSYLVCLLHSLQESKTIVFISTADQANFLEKILTEMRHLPSRKFEENYQGGKGEDKKNLLEELNKEKKIIDCPILKLHGHLSQEDRYKIYQEFCKVDKGVLLSTDVGSRGVDFPDVKLIILYDPPESLSHYSNRVGRTARLTKSGSSLIFLHPSEDLFVKVLIKRYPIKEYNPLKAFESFESSIPSYYPIGESIEYLNHAVKKRVSTDNDLYFLARRAFNSFCRAYSRIKNKTVFNLKNLHLHNLSKSFGLKSAKSNNETEKDGYTELDVKRSENYKETARQRDGQSGRIKLRAKKDSAVLKNEFL